MSETENSNNKGLKIDITSTVVEKGLDLVKDFLGKLISPAVEEAGLFLRDPITSWRFNKQINMLASAQAKCKKYNISPKAISLKLLCPLLENASLEDDAYLEDKWSTLLANLVDSSQNIDNHVFPYILGQISKNEFMFLERHYNEHLLKLAKLKEELRLHNIQRPDVIKTIKSEIRKLDKRIKNAVYPSENYHELYRKKLELGRELHYVDFHKTDSLENQINNPIIVPEDLESFEFSNLIRLGLLKEVQETYPNPQTLEIKNNPDQHYLSVDFEPDIYSISDTVFTDLGKLFVKACTLKIEIQ
jgi:hypothetical protein